jgi:hypothetical protein
MCGGRAGASYWPDALVLPGSKEQGIGTQGFSRNLGGPVVPTSITAGRELPVAKTPGLKPASGLQEKRKQAHGVVSPSEGNEVRRNGRQDVGAPHSTVEAGEQAPPGPWGGKEVPHHGIVGGKHARCTET